jgi:hypothetical protein
MDFEFWQAAYIFGWASTEQIKEAENLGLLTQDQAN